MSSFGVIGEMFGKASETFPLASLGSSSKGKDSPASEEASDSEVETTGVSELEFVPDPQEANPKAAMSEARTIKRSDFGMEYSSAY